MNVVALTPSCGLHGLPAQPPGGQQRFLHHPDEPAPTDLDARANRQFDPPSADQHGVARARPPSRQSFSRLHELRDEVVTEVISRLNPPPPGEDEEEEEQYCELDVCVDFTKSWLAPAQATPRWLAVSCSDPFGVVPRWDLSALHSSHLQHLELEKGHLLVSVAGGVDSCAEDASDAVVAQTAPSGCSGGPTVCVRGRAGSRSAVQVQLAAANHVGRLGQRAALGNCGRGPLREAAGAE
ncbi:hypothetical protein MCOR25_004826 [Pyricularia grisea]|nr:hypothetical protein MCOR25_004826 [Pyricularia grisea]